MAEPRIYELAKELLQRSRDRKVPWQEGQRAVTSSRDYYRVVFPEGALRVSGLRGTTGENAEYKLELISDTGRIIDSLAPQTQELMYETLSEIFDLAHTFILDRGINRALDFLKSR
jgi:hypothetical protein